MVSRYFPKTRKARLGWLTEECGEVLQTIGKIQRFGLDKYHPFIKSESNRQALLRELSDLKRAIIEVEKDIMP